MVLSNWGLCEGHRDSRGVQLSEGTSPVSHAGFTGLKLQLPRAITALVEPPPVVLEVVTLFLDQDKFP